MTQSQFSLSWEAHKKNICSGLSALQQNGEFVDMTLAADGHHVKVHQIIIALASPYIKELIASAQCQHPVIFLNKMSYATLSAILEYIYTGEVLVSIENLKDLVQAGKELRIKGLEDMNLHKSTVTPEEIQNETPMEEETLDDEICYFEISDGNSKNVYPSDNIIISDIRSNTNVVTESLEEVVFEDGTIQDEDNLDEENSKVKVEMNNIDDKVAITIPGTISGTMSSPMQYTVSNQGSLQMILNRFIYYLKHTNRHSMRHWRCVDYLSHIRCQAVVVTLDDVVIQRIRSHKHPFHDKKILKKIHANAIFSAIQEAELEGQNKSTNLTASNSDKDESEAVI